MPGFNDPLLLLGLLFIPLIYLGYKTIMKRKKREAMKFSHIGFIKSALGNKKKSRRNL